VADSSSQPINPPLRPPELAYATSAASQHGENAPPAEPSYLTAIALGFPGVLLMVFGLPMAITFPAGIIWGHSRLTWAGYIGIFFITVIGSIFVYAATLLLRSAARALGR
jgi:hypothetical protein